MSKPLTGRVTLVTGASRGIGYAAAAALAEAGSDIIALARTQGGLEALDDAVKAHGQTCTLVPMDLNQMDGIDRLGAIIHERWGKLDALLANAGMLGDITPVPHLDPKTWDKLVAVNLTANFRLIRSLDPLLRASDSGRALFLLRCSCHQKGLLGRLCSDESWIRSTCAKLCQRG
jgi:NAD(P)-dependent dehydrogenase (short-subunit alcohol dehydrogenase family)